MNRKTYVWKWRKSRKRKAGEENMRKIVYLNFELDKPEELLAYNFLESLGRAKKSVVLMALQNTQLLQNYVAANNMASLAVQGMILPDAKVRKAGSKQGKVNLEKKNVAKVMETTGQEVKEAETAKPVEKVTTDEKEEAQVQAFLPVVEEEPEAIFTEEQLAKIREKGLDLDALSDKQKRAMARMMAEEFMPATTAYSLAGFEK